MGFTRSPRQSKTLSSVVGTTLLDQEEQEPQGLLLRSLSPPPRVRCVPRAQPIEFFPADSPCDSFLAPGMPVSTQRPQAPVLSLVTAKCPREIPGRARGLAAHSAELPWALPLSARA